MTDPVSYDKGPLQLLLVEAKMLAGHDEQARRDIAFWGEIVLDPTRALTVSPFSIRAGFVARGWARFQTQGT